uniref:Uncharacterized protein n=1 Tax=Octopus bimaculoides TaxID=37653 RepID=A0A0L8G5E5_OCTBM
MSKRQPWHQGKTLWPQMMSGINCQCQIAGRVSDRFVLSRFTSLIRKTLIKNICIYV